MSFYKYFNVQFYLLVITNVILDVFPLFFLIFINKFSLLFDVYFYFIIIILLLFSVFVKFKVSLALNNNIQLFRHIYSCNTLSSLLSESKKTELELDDSARKILSESDFTVNSFARPIERLISSILLIFCILGVLLYQNFSIVASTWTSQLHVLP